MERFIFIFIHIGIPFIILWAAYRFRPSSGLGLVVSTVFYMHVLTFLYFWGQWPLAASLYFKYVVLAIMAFVLWKFFKSGPLLKKWWPRGKGSWIRAGIVTILALLTSIPVYQLLQGRSYPDEPVYLEFPMKDGSYFVALGGSNRTINNHYGTPSTSQWYALDFNKLGKYGMATTSLWSTANEDHAIYGEALYAPCKGQVLEVKDNVPDNQEASMDVSPADGMGNYVVLDCKGHIISLVHLQPNSIAVDEGQWVRPGDFLGRVGNSGFSQEPHLHLQAARYAMDSTLVAVPIQFKVGMPVRGDVIEN